MSPTTQYTATSQDQISIKTPSGTTPLILALTIFFPYAIGFLLSYYFRTINAVLASRLQSELGLDGPSIGVLTSAYFLTMTLGSIPAGICLDRFGPRAVQIVLLMIAAGGAYLTSIVETFWLHFLARSIVGFGIAGSLMAGLKAIALWYPRERVPFVNGLYLSFGAMGALAAALPTEMLLSSINWRQLFVMLAVLCAIASYLIAIAAPKNTRKVEAQPQCYSAMPPFSKIIRDRRFWSLAPLSATCFGSVWALQGLWAAPWLRDVGGLQQSEITHNLFLMALALCASGLCLGGISGALRRRGIGIWAVLGISSVILIAAEMTLVLGLEVPAIVPWSIIAFMGGGTALSYSMTAEWFDNHVIGRMNCLLNFINCAYAFIVQASFGWIAEHWPPTLLKGIVTSGYSGAMLVVAGAQVASAMWFAWSIYSMRRQGNTPK